LGRWSWSYGIRLGLSVERDVARIEIEWHLGVPTRRLVASALEISKWIVK
jgi:hypothetical protein